MTKWAEIRTQNRHLCLCPLFLLNLSISPHPLSEYTHFALNLICQTSICSLRTVDPDMEFLALLRLIPAHSEHALRVQKWPERGFNRAFWWLTPSKGQVDAGRLRALLQGHSQEWPKRTAGRAEEVCSAPSEHSRKSPIGFSLQQPYNNHRNHLPPHLTSHSNLSGHSLTIDFS